MLVNYLTDEPAKISKMRAILEPEHRISPNLLGAGGAQIDLSGVLMVDADLRQLDRIEKIKQTLSALGSIREKLFVVEKGVRSLEVQAYALGATGVVSRPKEIVVKLAQIVAAEKIAQVDAFVASSKLGSSAQAFASMFSSVFAGKPIECADAEHATSQIIDAVAQNGLTTWLDDVRRYHEGTFQHCLLVSGVAVGFAIELGFAALDVQRLGMAATLHDVGKARIPLAILDKPGRLDPAEEQTMRQHPVIGFDSLKGLPGIDDQMLDAVRHHHEYLDGSGYPDGLMAPNIPDLVRLLTISDVFAALIEARPYRKPMSRQTAYEILSGMDGKLEKPLVGAFKRIALGA